jgi:hypothetical protein
MNTLYPNGGNGLPTAPKGHDMIAQGNALGFLEPTRVALKGHDGSVLPTRYA